MYEFNNPKAVFGYIPHESRAHTPKLVQIKKNKFDEIPARVPAKILLILRCLNIFIAKIGSIKPLQVNKNIFELPIKKSDNAIVPKVSKKVFFLSR
jgi:hypothetical protein